VSRVNVETIITVGDVGWFVVGEVWLGNTPPNGPNPTEVLEWHVVGGSSDALVDAIFEDTNLTHSECVDRIESMLVDAAIDTMTGRAWTVRHGGR
jgi:hypothetical protein